MGPALCLPAVTQRHALGYGQQPSPVTGRLTGGHGGARPAAPARVAAPQPTDVRTPRGSPSNHSFLYLWDPRLTGVGSGSGWPSSLPHLAPSRLPLTPPQVIGEGTWSRQGDWLGAACAPGELANRDSYRDPPSERHCEVRNTQVCPSSGRLSWKLSAEDWAGRKRRFQAHSVPLLTQLTLQPPPGRQGGVAGSQGEGAVGPTSTPGPGPPAGAS